MPTLADLKAQHPIWDTLPIPNPTDIFDQDVVSKVLVKAWKDGGVVYSPSLLETEITAKICRALASDLHALCSALIAKALEDEARLAEQGVELDMVRTALNRAGDNTVGCYNGICTLINRFTAEREAHEVTRKALAEADRALLFWRGYPEYVFSSDMEDGEPKRAVKAALAREESRKKGAEHGE